MKNIILEIACFNPESALFAEKAGATRIEFCTEMKEGGTTPNINDFIWLKKELSIPIHVMIRPRGGNFVYSDREIEWMKMNIIEFKNKGADAFVFGILDENNEVNIKQNKLLVELAKPIPCTFHRAFDRVKNHQKSLEEVIDCGFKAILTSGTKPDVVEGKEILKDLITQAKIRIDILCGGGLRSSNVAEIKNFTGATSFHSSAITDGSETANENEILKLLNFLL